MPRGKVRSLRIHREVYQKWAYKCDYIPSVDSEVRFLGSTMTTRAFAYANAVANRLRLELQSRSLPDSKARVLIMLLQLVFDKVIVWMNQAINLRTVQRALLTLADM